MRFLNASVLERKALNRNLSWGFPLGNLLPKTRVLKHRVLERKRRPNVNASVLGTQRFRTLSSYRFKSFSGAVSFCRHAALTKSLKKSEKSLLGYHGAPYPKDPAVLKILRHSKFTMRSTPWVD